MPPVLRAEIERESARLTVVRQQVKAMEAERRQELADGKQPLVTATASNQSVAEVFSGSCTCVVLSCHVLDG